MPVQVTASVSGLRDLERALLDLAPKEARKALRIGLRAGGKIVEAEAKALLPISSAGLLEGALRIRVGISFAGAFSRIASLPGFGRIGVTSAGEETQGRLIVKVGTYKPSKVAGESKKYPYDPYYARWVEFGTVKMAAQPFMRPALEQNQSRILQILKQKTKAAIDKINRRA